MDELTDIYRMPPFLTDIYRPIFENNTTNMVSNRCFNGHLQEPIVFNGQMWDRKNKETDIYGEQICYLVDKYRRTYKL